MANIFNEFFIKFGITLERLKEDGIASCLLKIVDEKGNEKLICPVCYEGWT